MELASAIMLINYLSAAITAGINLEAAFSKASDMIKAAHAKGETITAPELAALFDAGDEVESQAHAKFLAAMQDVNTPKIDDSGPMDPATPKNAPTTTVSKLPNT